MGMFDTVRVPCPKCGVLYDAQSKSGECILGYYDFPLLGAENPAPANVMDDINRHAPFICIECGTTFKAKTIKEAIVIPGEWEVEAIND